MTTDVRRLVAQIEKERQSMHAAIGSLEQKMRRVIIQLEKLCNDVETTVPDNVYEINPPEQPKDYPLTSGPTDAA